MSTQSYSGHWKSHHKSFHWSVAKLNNISPLMIFISLSQKRGLAQTKTVFVFNKQGIAYVNNYSLLTKRSRSSKHDLWLCQSKYLKKVIVLCGRFFYYLGNIWQTELCNYYSASRAHMCAHTYANINYFSSSPHNSHRLHIKLLPRIKVTASSYNHQFRYQNL